jgi:hypothetical protein
MFYINARLLKATPSIKIRTVLAKLTKLAPNEIFSENNTDDIKDGVSYWCDDPDHMKKLSSLFKGVLFTMIDNYSCHYCYEGKSQKAEITYSTIHRLYEYTPFNEELLGE